MRRDICILAAGGGLYWLNRLWLRYVTAGVVRWFCACYLSDILAGLVLPAVVSLILFAARRPPLLKWRSIALLLLGAGLVWECLTPLWKPGAVFDLWDLAAYQAGGLAFFLLHHCEYSQSNAGN